MTRKHFKALAEGLHTMLPHSGGFQRMEDWDYAMTRWSESVRAIATVCAESDPRFSRRRFIAACEKGT